MGVHPEDARSPPGEALSDTLTRTVLHRGSGTELHDLRCRAACHAPSAEEHSDATRIVFPRRGVFVRHLGGRALVADPNQVLCFARGEVYRVSHPVRMGGDDCTVLGVDDALLAEALARQRPHTVLDLRAPLGAPQVLGDARIGYVLARLRQCLRDPRAERLAVDGVVLDLLDAALRRAPPTRPLRPGVRHARDPDTDARQRALVDRTLLVLSARHAEDLTLTDLARAVRASPYHLSRTFQQEAGLGLHRYRTRLRLMHGLARLLDGERDLARLALELGFSSHSHFTDVFRRAFGVAPSRCRHTLDSRRVRALSKNLTVALGPSL